MNQAISDSFKELHEWTEWAKTPQTTSETAAYIEFSKKCWLGISPEELPLLIFNSEEKELIEYQVDSLT